ncbi:MAG: HIT family hydrolase, partial [Paeniglutamicibacter sp.]
MGESTNAYASTHPGGASQEAADAAISDDFELAGVPDSFQRLWTPYRMAYIKAGQDQVKDEES